MNHSSTISKLATALYKAQGALVGAKKDSVNTHYKNSYADLESVWEACRKPLSDNELSIVQTPQIIDGEPYLATVLLHSSGEWMQSLFPLLARDRTPQAFGIALSYARRYALAAMVGVVQTDDDGELAQGRDNGKEYKPEYQAPQKMFKKIEKPEEIEKKVEKVVELISETEAEEIEKMMAEEDAKYRKDVLAYYTAKLKLEKPMTDFIGFPKSCMKSLMSSILRRQKEREKKKEVDQVFEVGF